MWMLQRIWHVEVLGSVATNPNAHLFLRTSYCVAPLSWVERAEAVQRDRIRTLVDASYARRNRQMAQTGDATETWWLGFSYELVDDGREMPPSPEDVAARIWLRSHPEVAPELVGPAIAELTSAWRKPRPGLAARPWESAFTSFAVDEEENWKILRAGDAATLAVFAERLG
jgi:hypothetical protein